MTNDYNSAVVPMIVDYLKNTIRRIEINANETMGKVSIKLDKYRVLDTNNLSISYLQVHGLTGYFTCKLYYKITIDGNITNFDEDLNIPKMIRNAFVIDGSLRVPTNTLDNDSEINIYQDNIRINSDLSITYSEDPHEPGGYKLTAYCYDEPESLVFDLTDDNIIKYRDLFKLTKTQINKIKVKLDTDEVGEYLTRDCVIKLAELGSDRFRDSIIDKKIYSPESNLIKYLYSRDVRRKIYNKMKDKFYQYNKIFIRDIQNAIDRYFRIASEKNIDFPNSTNPMGFDSLKYKIIIPKTVTYNDTMTDIIDVANTPINLNVNVINELNVCAVIKNDVIYIKCYTYPSQEPVEVEYTEYCTKKVILNDCWDYDKKSFRPDKQIGYKLRLKRREGTASENYDYIEPKPDDKLSITTRRIPFGNMSDSVRISMGTGMLKQSVELDQSEPSLVTPGYDEEDINLSTLMTTHYGDNATVVQIKDNKVFVKNDSDGSIIFYEIPDPMVGQNDTIISFETNVKVGQKLKKGDLIIQPHELRRKSFELGTNANVVYLNYLGYTYEDGQCISESFAKKLKHYSILNVILPIYPDDIIGFISKIGSKVTSKDILVNNQTKLRVSAAAKNAYTNGGILQGLGISYTQSNLVVPNNTDLGYVLDVDVHIEKDRPLTAEYSRKVIEDYFKDNKSDDYKDIPERFKELKADTYEINDNMSGYISVKIIRVDIAKIGDKLTNRYGGKGMISLVIPDNCMPVIEKADGSKITADLILNPAGVLHRKNISQIYECELGKCIQMIYSKVSDMIRNNQLKEIKPFLNKYYGDQFEAMTVADIVNLHKTKGIFAYQMKVGFFSKISRQTILDWMKELGVPETERVFLPSITLVETRSGLKVFPLGTYQKQDGDGKATDYELGYAESECVTGNEYILKLYHTASYSGKATPYIEDNPYPVMGRGIYRQGGGQKIGEMEEWILLETGTERFLQEQSPDMITNQYVFLNELLLAGYYVQDRKGNPLLSDQRDNVESLENLIKLNNPDKNKKSN